jgi:3-hydroxymyristoyl/3-hydroxydecanoyl-(acyl carrier protein) dehydratase
MNDVHLSLQIPREHPSYAGHFPGQPIVPGVVLLDLVLQAAEGLAHWPGRPDSPLEIPVCKFVQAVSPGAILALTLSTGSSAGTLNFRLQQDGQPVASGSLRRTPPAA